MGKLRGRLFPPRSSRKAVDEELDFHVSERVDELVAAGYEPAAARREVLRRFGDVGKVRDSCLEIDRQREQRRRWRDLVSELRDDAALAAKSLRRSPRYTFLVLGVLALGLGATTTVWSVFDRVLLQPLPFAEPERLVRIFQFDRVTGTDREPASYPDYLDFEERSRSFGAVAAFTLSGANLVLSSDESREAQRVTVAAVSHDLLDVLGRRTLRGRDFEASDDVLDGPAVALVEESFWRERLQADEGVVGATLRLDGRLVTVIGVVSGGLEVPSEAAEVWLPLQQTPETSPRWSHSLQIVARLAEGATHRQASDEVVTIAAQLEEEYRENAGRGAVAEPLPQTLRGESRPALRLLLGAVCLMLAIACANVANLMLARGTERAGEVALSAALGASSARWTRRLTLEALFLSSAAVLLGCLLTLFGSDLLLLWAPESVRRLAEQSSPFEPRILAFAALAALLTTTLFSVVGAAQARRTDLHGLLRRSTGNARNDRSWLKRCLVVAQFALAVPLLLGALLLMLSLERLSSVDKGFQSKGVLRADLQLPQNLYPQDMSQYPHWQEIHQFNRRALEGAQALAGVGSAALTISHPLDPGFTNSFSIVGREHETSDLGELKTRMVSPSYFATNGVATLAGRLPNRSDTADSPPVLVINQRAVERYFPDSDPVGQRIAFWGIEREIVGVVGNERIHGLREEAPEAMYLSILQAPQRSRITLMVKTDSDPQNLIGPLRELVQSIDPPVALFDVTTMDATLRSSLARERFTSLLLALFAVAAVLLAGFGVHGVLSYLVAVRRREVGLRRALGATRREVLSQVVGDGARLATAGVVLGTLLSLATADLLQSLLFGVSRAGVPLIVTVALGLLGLSVLACWLPARAAARTPPSEVLRG
ncbi:MAG: ADOP family duplicated permease [Acidobacteriota bacterium]